MELFLYLPYTSTRLNQFYIMFEITFDFKLIEDIFYRFVFFNQITVYNLYNINFLIINVSFRILDSINKIHALC